MNFSTLYSLILVCLFQLVSADTDSFTLDLYAPDTILADCSIYVSEDKIYIANTTNTCKGFISTNGSLIIDNYSVGIGKNYLSLVGESASFESVDSWSIEDGYLKLYGNDFHAVPSGMDDIYVLGSVNAAAGRDDVIPVGIKANTGNSDIKSYDPPSVTGSTTYSILETTQTFKTSSSKGAGNANQLPGIAAAGAFVAYLLY